MTRMGRRDFVRKGMLAAGATGAGLGAFQGLTGGAGAQDAHVHGAKEPPTCPPPPAGGPVQVRGNGSACCGPADLAASRRGIAGRKWTMVIDLARCDGCGHCSRACSKMHVVPPDREWIKVYAMRDAPDTAPYWFPRPCFHCDSPPCTKVCPVDATFKRLDGIVLVDNVRCIGCRFCMAACPYSVRVFNWGRPKEPPDAAAAPYRPETGYPRRMGTVEKCDFCPEMAAVGQLPACTSGCPQAAIYYGDQNEDAVTNSKGETERLSRLVRERAGYHYLEELGTRPRVFYLPPRNRVYSAPGEAPAAGHDHTGAPAAPVPGDHQGHPAHK
jgi:Fe-S-cluster-containing dehydrogenase component